MIKLNVEYVEDGPIFSPEATKIVDRFMTQAEQTVGDQLVTMIQQDLRAHIKHWSGNLSAHVKTSNMGTNLAVTDSGVVYGSWIEGVSRRNAATRFKGYSSFRRMAQEVEGRVNALIERDVSQMVKALGG